MPSSSICRLVTIATSAGLGGPVGAHVRSLPQGDIGTHEDEVAALTLDHAGEHRGGQPVGPDQVDLDLRFESLGVDFVQSPEVGVAGTGDQHLDVAELFGGLVHESFDGIGLGDVERQRDRLTAAGADLLDELLALLNAPRAQCHRKAMRGKVDRGGRSDARRCAGDDRGPAGRMRFEAGHSGNLHADR